jgi:hypothetical protein
MRKQFLVWERSGVLIGHDEISLLCEWLGFTDPTGGQFVDWLNKVSDQELRSWLEKLKKKRKALYNYLQNEEKIYA